MTNNSSSPAPSKGRFLAYLRVSTPKQGEGSSLITQREAIARFAHRRGLEIVGWYEEKESAARRGRPVFGQVLRLVSSGKADGLIVHKVDRSARNLKDWADLGELIDRGVPVYFAGDDLDLTSRSGRLAADIQAVIAADYVRNLKEEAKRGIQKRLEQGFCPNGAPLGYLDSGPAKVKRIDPSRAPFIRMPPTSVTACIAPSRCYCRFMIHEEIRTERDNTDAWICVCLNEPHMDGFFPCDSAGQEMDPVDGWTELYVCHRCGRIIDQGSLKIVTQTSRSA